MADARAKSAQLGSESSVKRMQQARRRLSEKRVEQLQTPYSRLMQVLWQQVDASVVAGSVGGWRVTVVVAAQQRWLLLWFMLLSDSADLGMDADANEIEVHGMTTCDNIE